MKHNMFVSFARSIIISFAMLVACGGAATSTGSIVACRQGPRGQATSAVVPDGDWRARAELAISTLGDSRGTGALSLAITVVSIWPMPEADRATAVALLRSVRDDFVPRLGAAVRASDRCGAEAALVQASAALGSAATALAAALRWDLPDALRMGLDLMASVADELAPGCVADAGWSSRSSETRARMAARPSRLRPFPTVEEAREEASSRR